MKPALKKARITFLVLTSILFVAWAALTVFFVIIFSKGYAVTPAAFIKDLLSELGKAFKLPPASGEVFLGTEIKGVPLLDTILTYSFTGVFGVLALILLIVAIAKKRFGFITYVFIVLLFGFAAVQVGSYTTQFFHLFQNVPGFANKVLVYATFGTGAATALFNLIFAIILPCSIVSRKVKDEHIKKEKERKERILAGVPAVPAPEFVPEPEPKEAPLSKFELANLIREIVRDEVARSELSRPQPQPAAPVIVTPPAPEKVKEEEHGSSRVQTVTGATFGGPLVVQYFYGIAPTTNPQPQPEVKAEPAPAPVEEAAPVVEEPTPVVPVEAKAPIVRIPFEERIVSADKAMKDNYNELKNEILSYGVKSRISNSGDTFRLHRKTYVKITIAGKSLKLYFALDPKDYKDSTIPFQDAGEKNAYAEIPFVFKVKSELSMKRAKQLIQDVMEKDGLEQGVVESVNWVKEIKASLKAAK